MQAGQSSYVHKFKFAADNLSIQITAKKYTSGLEYSIMKEVSMEMFKRPNVRSNTRIVVYEFEMLERFLKKIHIFLCALKDFVA